MIDTTQNGERRGGADIPPTPTFAGRDGKRNIFGSATEDLAGGQIVVVTARWILIFAGILIALWNPGAVEELRTQVVGIFLLAKVNFFLHAQLLVHRPVLDRVVYAASLGDIAVISAIVLSQGGFASSNYIFYYPVILAFSVAFPRSVTTVFTAIAAITYGLICLGSVSPNGTEMFVRILTMVGVGTCGSLYWSIERDRRAGAATATDSIASMQSNRSPQQEAAEDVFFGQLVIIVARYFLIATVLGVLLWDISTPAGMALAVAPVAAFLAINFFLHARYLMEQPANLRLIALTATVDLVLVTLIVVAWPGHTGLASPFFVLYYPLILAFAFVTPRPVGATYTALAIVLYGTAVLLLGGADIFSDVGEAKALVLRMVTFAATGGIANYYWRTLRAGRRAIAATAA